jgi:hypothetical protein
VTTTRAGKSENVRGDSWASRTSELPSERSWIIIMKNVRTKGLGNKLIAPKTTVIGTGPIKCRERLGGVLKFYYREAA